MVKRRKEVEERREWPEESRLGVAVGLFFWRRNEMKKMKGTKRRKIGSLKVGSLSDNNKRQHGEKIRRKEDEEKNRGRAKQNISLYTI